MHLGDVNTTMQEVTALHKAIADRLHADFPKSNRELPGGTEQIVNGAPFIDVCILRFSDYTTVSSCSTLSLSLSRD